jgi:hypothetical protein
VGNTHPDDVLAGAAVTDSELLAMARALEQRHGPFRDCTRCAVPLCGTFERRLYSIAAGAGFALVALCDSCAEALPPDSPANAAFRDQLERSGLAYVPPQGRA